MDAPRIQITSGASARPLLEDADFCARWSELLAACPWGTGFQSPAYVGTWYRMYAERFGPVVVHSHDADGRLCGLLCLAFEAASGRLVMAGDVQAEYQTCLAHDGSGDGFFLSALRAVAESYPRCALQVANLPPGTPMGWLSDSWARRVCHVQAQARPLLRFGDGKQIAASLAKRSNKNRIRQIEKMGRLTFERLVDLQAMRELYEAIAPFYDARHAALRGEPPFRMDPRMKPFGLALTEAPGLLHVTAMRAGDHIVCAHFGVCGGREVQLGLLAHNPWFARYSPGKFHILFLARMLMGEGYEQLDLTAGGDPYKERFANAWDRVHTLRVYPTALSRRAGAIRCGLKSTAKRALRAVGLSPARAVAIRESFWPLRPLARLGAVAGCVAGWLGKGSELRVYSASNAEVADEQGSEFSIRRDALEDLLDYRPRSSGPSLRAFMAEALRRAEELCHVYTCVRDGRLVHCAWVLEGATAEQASELIPGFDAPAGSTLITEFQTFPEARRQGMATACLRAIVRDVLLHQGATRVVVAIPAQNAAARSVIERAGLIDERSVVRRARWAPVPARRPAKAQGHSSGFSVNAPPASR